MYNKNKMEKPTVVISACLNGYFNRYNGGTVSDDQVNALKPRFELINVCPEVEVGLGIPRKTLSLFRIGNRAQVIQKETGLDLTERLREFSEKKIASLPEVDGFILKAKSPSCGVKISKGPESWERMTEFSPLPCVGFCLIFLWSTKAA